MKIIYKWAFFTGALYIIYYFIIYNLRLEALFGSKIGLSSGLLILITVLSFILIYFGIKEYRDSKFTERFTLIQGFWIGMKIVLFSSIIGAVFTILYKVIIEPNYSEIIKSITLEELKKYGVAEDEDINAKIGESNIYISAGMTFIMLCFNGVFKALIAGSMCKKNPS